MELDLGTGIIGIVLILLTIAPIIYLNFSGGSKTKKFKKEFMELAKEENLEITTADFWSNTYGIGLDLKSHRLLYLKNRNGEKSKLVIEFNQVRSCKAVKIMDGPSVDRLDLVLTFHDPKIPVRKLEFYNGDERMSLMDENQLAEKWTSLVQLQLKSKAA